MSRLQTLLAEKRVTAYRRQIRKLIMLMRDEKNLRRVAQYAGKIWLDETGGELIEKE